MHFGLVKQMLGDRSTMYERTPSYSKCPIIARQNLPVIIKTTEGEFKRFRNETSYEQLFMEEGEDLA